MLLSKEIFHMVMLREPIKFPDKKYFSTRYREQLEIWDHEPFLPLGLSSTAKSNSGPVKLSSMEKLIAQIS